MGGAVAGAPSSAITSVRSAVALCAPAPSVANTRSRTLRVACTRGAVRVAVQGARRSIVCWPSSSSVAFICSFA